MATPIDISLIAKVARQYLVPDFAKLFPIPDGYVYDPMPRLYEQRSELGYPFITFHECECEW